MRTFALIAFVSSFAVFLVFSLRLVWQEEAQIERHLRSFKGVAEQFYAVSPTTTLKLSEYVTVYYGEEGLTDQLKQLIPMQLDTVDRLHFEVRPSQKEAIVPGVIAYYFAFQHQGDTIPTYIAISSFEMDLWDDNWGVLMVIATLLMLFLIIVLRITLKRVFDQLAMPITNLSEQLLSHDQGFSISKNSVDELQQLTAHLNSYSEMKDRLAQQELMFAKYASHELKTPIAIVQGAAELQAMKPDDSAFQAKQRDRILGAANGMSATVEVLLNIVKQENATAESSSTPITPSTIELSKYRTMLPADVSLTLDVEPDTVLNMPIALVNMVLKNYIENAIRFTQQGEIHVSISSHEISVVDTGVGLQSNAKAEHGLGLIIVSRIGESYGWTSTLENNSDVPASPLSVGCRAVFTRQSNG
ncbi:HAMP domain-containing histidine kinase [Vibrio sp. D404a]|uniref:sensor histidine kinase n=1 Tax=unclassified Vibrio TaxID=2614977 RepID=UPI00255498D6|nr:MULTISPECIES: HAMP domain-containing sensor histidine kinase [unclassified Vibrio]MDK9738829.1 HAMP domain-containing histidine kinase [Vibrio sp. D404a]MDK9798396.1 HAMP domain-containing histidine kinase [Vibrio sp. D449a]